MNYPTFYDTAQASSLGYVVPVIAWIVLTGAVFSTIKLFGIRVRLAGFLLSIVVSGGLVGWFVHSRTHKDSSYRDIRTSFNEWSIPRKDHSEFLAMVNGGDFKVECGRHLAPADRLRGLLARSKQWELQFENSSAYSKHAPIRYRMEATGLTAQERVLFDPWFSAWRQEVEWAAMIALWRAHHRAVIVGRAQAQPYLDSKGPLGSIIYHAPSSRYVRQGLLSISKDNTNAHTRAFCLIQIKAAREADKRVGLPPDPLLKDLPAAPVREP